MSEPAVHRSGFVNIIGSPNVGKSTLMNALVGEQLSIITRKAQTTRHRIKGIVNGENHQVVFSDTPGILEPAYKLHEGMMNFVLGALQDADILVIMTEGGQKQFPHVELLPKVQQSAATKLVLINKIDLIDPETLEERVRYWEGLFPGSAVLPISALNKINIEQVWKHLMAHLPESPPYFPKDELTDRPLRFFMAEIIREKIFLHYKKEIPYSCEVTIESFKEEPKLIRISGIIMVARDTQKGIVIGHQGKALKRVGTEARVDMEAFLGKKVFLELRVKVDKDWRNNARKLKGFGYLQ